MAGRPFLLYPANEHVLQDNTKIPQQGLGKLKPGLVALMLLPFIAVALVLMAITGNTLYEESLLANNATVVDGRVTNRTIYEDTDRRTNAQGYRESRVVGYTYTLFYEYSFAERVYTGQQDVTQGEYNAYPIDSVIPIITPPSRPSVSRIDGIDRGSSNGILVGFTAVWTLLVGIFSLVFYRAWAKSRRLARHGKLIEGEIVEYKGEKIPGGSGYQVHLKLRFRSPETGEWVEAKRTYTANHHQNTRPPAGTLLAILHADDKVWEVL